MDTLIGRPGGKTILTLDFVFCNFMARVLLPDQSAASVSFAILSLKRTLAVSHISFGALIPLILTDNGGEFSDVLSIESDLNDNKETHLFSAILLVHRRSPMSRKTIRSFGILFRRDLLLMLLRKTRSI